MSALPVLLALILQAMAGAVDLLVVGQFGGAAICLAVEDSTAARSCSLSHPSLLIMMGATILIGQAYRRRS